MAYNSAELLREMESKFDSDIYANYDIVNDFNYFQRSCLEGRSEEVKDTLALGLVDLNKSENGPKFLPLVLATYSSSAETVFEILDGGINGGLAIRSALKLASSLGHYHVSDVIKNFVSRLSLKVYTSKFNMSAPLMLSNFHRFVCETNIHPVRIAINVLKYQLSSHLEDILKLLNMMSKDEMDRERANGSRGLKYFYMAAVVNEIGRFESESNQFFGELTCSNSTLEIAVFYFIICFHTRQGRDSIMAKLFRYCLRDFKYHNSDIHRTLLRNSSGNTHQNELTILRDTIMCPRIRQVLSNECSCCGKLFAVIQCSLCTETFYCSEPCLLYYSKIHEEKCTKDLVPNVGNEDSTSHNHSTEASETDSTYLEEGIPSFNDNAESEGAWGDSIDINNDNVSDKLKEDDGKFTFDTMEDLNAPSPLHHTPYHRHQNRRTNFDTKINRSQ